MQIKEAEEKDIPEILEVLKASLGETSSKKTEKVWRYKHIDNPFGKSLVLLAVEDEAIIGVRAFMRWNWQKNDKIYSCFRAVDTATHPSHQGKGVFKKLTLEAIDRAKSNKDHFIFNTPNNQSLPGYLKMNWERVDKIKVNLYPMFIKGSFRSSPLASQDSKVSKEGINEFLNTINRKNSLENKFFTPKNIEYLNWRYKNNPMQSYEIYEDEGIYLAGYVKSHKYFKELRLSEVIVDKDLSKTAKSVIRKWSSKFGTHIVSSAESLNFTLNPKISGGFGPTLTVRNLNLSSGEYAELLKLESFSYALGDLELF